MGNWLGRKAGIGGLALVLDVVCFGGLGGCPNVPETSTTENESVTGIFGLNTTDEILANNSIRTACEQVRNAGYELNLSQELSPPNLEGIFEPDREKSYQIFPFSGAIVHPFLVLNIQNQTPDNYIDAFYTYKDSLEEGVAGRELKGKRIVRGNKDENKFTIYGIENVYSGEFCHSEQVSIIDGRIDNDGRIYALEINTPVKVYTPRCIFIGSADYLGMEILEEKVK
jgi:hypothetical protein